MTAPSGQAIGGAGPAGAPEVPPGLALGLDAAGLLAFAGALVTAVIGQHAAHWPIRAAVITAVLVVLAVPLVAGVVQTFAATGPVSAVRARRAGPLLAVMGGLVAWLVVAAVFLPGHPALEIGASLGPGLPPAAYDGGLPLVLTLSGVALLVRSPRITPMMRWMAGAAALVSAISAVGLTVARWRMLWGLDFPFPGLGVSLSLAEVMPALSSAVLAALVVRGLSRRSPWASPALCCWGFVLAALQLPFLQWEAGVPGLGVVVLPGVNIAQLAVVPAAALMIAPVLVRYRRVSAVRRAVISGGAVRVAGVMLAGCYLCTGGQFLILWRALRLEQPPLPVLYGAVQVLGLLGAGLMLWASGDLVRRRVLLVLAVIVLVAPQMWFWLAGDSTLVTGPAGSVAQAMWNDRLSPFAAWEFRQSVVIMILALLPLSLAIRPGAPVSGAAAAQGSSRHV